MKHQRDTHTDPIRKSGSEGFVLLTVLVAVVRGNRIYLASETGLIQCLHEIEQVEPLDHLQPIEPAEPKIKEEKGAAPPQAQPVQPAQPAVTAPANPEDPFGSKTAPGMNDPFGAGGADPFKKEKASNPFE